MRLVFRAPPEGFGQGIVKKPLRTRYVVSRVLSFRSLRGSSPSPCSAGRTPVEKYSVHRSFFARGNESTITLRAHGPFWVVARPYRSPVCRAVLPPTHFGTTFGLPVPLYRNPQTRLPPVQSRRRSDRNLAEQRADTVAAEKPTGHYDPPRFPPRPRRLVRGPSLLRARNQAHSPPIPVTCALRTGLKTALSGSVLYGVLPGRTRNL